jgi:hypothetical protein
LLARLYREAEKLETLCGLLVIKNGHLIGDNPWEYEGINRLVKKFIKSLPRK